MRFRLLKLIDRLMYADAVIDADFYVLLQREIAIICEFLHPNFYSHLMKYYCLYLKVLDLYSQQISLSSIILRLYILFYKY